MANPYLPDDAPQPAAAPNPYLSASTPQSTAPDFSGGTLQFATPFGNLDTGMPIPDSMNAWLAGAGKYFSDKYAGAKQMSGGVANNLGLISDNALGQINQDAAQARSPADAALLRDPRAAAGYFTSGLASFAPVAAASVPAAAGVGLVSGALDPATSSVDRLVNSGLSAATAGGAQGVIGSAANLFAPAAQSVLTTALNRARQFGISVLPGQATGSPMLQWIERGMGMFPGSSGVMKDAADANNAAAARVMASSIGENGETRITPDVLNRAATNIGQTFDAYKSIPTPINFGPDYFNAVRSVADAESQLPKASQNPQVFNLADSYAPDWAQGPSANPQSTMAQVVAARQRLASDAGDAFKSGNSSLGQAQSTIVNALDDAIQGSLGDQAGAGYALARNQWRNLLAIQKAADPSGLGNPSLLKLGTALRQQNPQSWARTPWGQDDLLDLSRVGSILKDTLGNSGTAQRESQMHTVGTLGTVAGGAVLGHELGGGVEGMLTGAASPLLAWGLAKGYQLGPTQALARTLFPGQLAGQVTSPLARLLMSGTAQAAGQLPSYMRGITPLGAPQGQ